MGLLPAMETIDFVSIPRVSFSGRRSGPERPDDV